MNNFMTLFKHELKMRFPLKPQKGKRVDILGTALSLLMITFIAAVFIKLLTTVASNYTLVKVNKISDPIMRTKELLNVCYIAVIIALVIAGLENMRKTLTDTKYKAILLRLPVTHQTIFASKLATLLISNYILALLLVVAVSLIFYISVSALTPIFWLMTFIVWLLLPMASFLIATILLVPYIKLIEFLSRRYVLTFVTVSAAVMGAFLLYSAFLNTVQSLLETGSIKFLFNEKFITTLQSMLKWAYPANCFANIALASNIGLSLAIALGIAAVAVLTVYLISKKLFYATLYKNSDRFHSAEPKAQKHKLPPLVALMKKEFVCILREPKHLFSYFAIAASMPLMVYCCYTMFESLILSMIGLNVAFPLAVLIVLIFSILTNTFCSNNVTRDGAAAIKVKMYPVKASTILLAKVLLCAIVSSLSIIVSMIVLAAASSLTAFDAFIIALIAIVFSTSQIFVATRMDLNGAKLSSTLAEMKSASNRTIAKVVILGLILALSAGILSFVSFVLSGSPIASSIIGIELKEIHAYLIPAGIGILYLGASVFYYSFRIEKSLDGLVI